MKLLVAIIQPRKLDYLTSALRRAGIPGITVTPAKGFGKETAESDWDLSGELSNKVKVELVVQDEKCEEIVRIVQKTVSTGKPGDGLIYVQDLVFTVRISTGERRTGEINIEQIRQSAQEDIPEA